MRVQIVTLCLFTLGFAGCFGESAPEPEATEPPEEPPEGQTTLLPYEVPSGAGESELDGAHTHDVWGATDLYLLFKGQAETTDCGSPVGNVLDTYATVVREQAVHSGCASWRFDDGVVVPEGTERITLELDVTDAADAGEVQLWLGNKQRAFAPYGEPTSADDPSWEIPVAVSEWDPAHAEETLWAFELRPSGNAAVLDGAVQVTSFAHKIPGWVPILGSAHIDHWSPEAEHVFVAPDAMRILATDIEVARPSYAAEASGAEPVVAVPLDDIVPPGATAVAIVLRYDDGVAGCPPGHECRVRPALNPIGSRVDYRPTLERVSPTFGVYYWQVPEPVVPDSTYVDESAYQLVLDIEGCPAGQSSGFGRVDPCQGAAANDLTADVTVLMEAYRGELDLHGIQGRAGV